MKRLPLHGQAPLSRRDLLRWVSAAAALRALPACDTDGTELVPPGDFFTFDERNALGALADVVLPPDDMPGAQALGAATYIERLLTALDGASPQVFAGGPFSGRTPFAAPDGAPGTTAPADSFSTFLALDRVNLAAWHLYLYGSSGTPGGGPNDAVLGPVVGLRDQIKTLLATAMQNAPAPLQTLSASQLSDVFFTLDPTSRALLVELVCEAAMSPPEYGGNVGLAGWAMCHFEGDSQPLGYSLYDTVDGGYRELPDTPVSTADPGPDPEPMDEETLGLVAMVIALAGGQAFS